MQFTALLLPTFVQVALTLGLLIWLGSLRVTAVRSGAVDIRDIQRGEPGWPQPLIQIAHAYRSQLELPLLFYVLVVLALILGRATTTLVVLAWLFVIARLLHALILVTTNDVPRKFAVFTVGLSVLVVMWLIFGLSVLLDL
jgi:hypothetical protein